MKPLSKHQQSTLAKNRGIEVERGLNLLNARGRRIPPAVSFLVMAVAASLSKPRK